MTFLMSFLFLVVSAHGAELPLCPSENLLLDESYPAAVVVVSDVASSGYESEKWALVRKFIPEVLKSSNAKILFVAKKENYQALMKELDPVMQKRVRRLNKISLTNWVQDPWVIQFDPKNGHPVLRPLQKYSAGFDANKMVQAVKTDLAATVPEPVPVSIGPDLAALGKNEALSGQYGGNVLALGSYCFVGASSLKDKFSEFSQQVCGSKNNIVKVPTSFLKVGHADEVMKALPIQKLAASNGECSMALAVGSPRRALKVLEQNPDDLFFDFRDNEQKNLARKAAVVQIEDRHFYKMLCLRMKGIPRKPPSMWLNDAYAEDKTENDLEPCLDMKNKDFLKFYKTHADYQKALAHIQDRLDDFVKGFSEQHKKQNPKCQLQVLELPQLFAGKIRQTLRSGFKPRMENAQSLFPNPSNGEVYGQKYIMPDPVSASFRKDVSKSMADLGLTPVFLDTHFAHRLQGNLHCSEKTLRQCRPR